MADMYNITNITAANNIMEMYVATDQLSGHIITAMLMFTLFLVIFLVFGNYNKKVVLMVDSFVMTIVGLLFMAIDMMTWTILIIPILMLFLSIFVWYFWGE